MHRRGDERLSYHYKIPGVSKNLYSPPLPSLLFTSHPLNPGPIPPTETTTDGNYSNKPPIFMVVTPPPLFNYVVQQRSLWRGMHDLNRAMRYIDKLERGGRGWGWGVEGEVLEILMRGQRGVLKIIRASLDCWKMREKGFRRRGGGGMRIPGILVGGRLIDSMKRETS